MDKISMTLTVYFEEGFGTVFSSRNMLNLIEFAELPLVQSLARRNCWIF